MINLDLYSPNMDKISPEKRSWTMAQVKSRDTKPEKIVRSLLHRLGYRFRLHRKDLPGRPDIVLPKYRTVVFVHGCFWHGHVGCKRARVPVANNDYWRQKLERNTKRDAQNKVLLESLGWRVFVVWECELKAPDLLQARLIDFFNSCQAIKSQ